MKKDISIHWYRQDLRVSDNPALTEAAKHKKVLPIYILEDLNSKSYSMGSASRWWLYHSLLYLSKSLDGNFMSGANSFSSINDRDGSDFDKTLFDEKTGLQKGQRKRTMESYSSDRERGVQIPKPDSMHRNVPALG